MRASRGPDEANLAAYGEAVVISQPWGGLGDNLQFSTLPERFAELGLPVFISDQNATRNREIHDLVWARNPHVRGVSPLPPNAGSCRGDAFAGLPPFTNFISRVEESHGLAPRNLLPKLYYAPRPRPDVADLVLIDVRSTSVRPPAGQLREYVTRTIRLFGYDPTRCRLVTLATAVARSDPAIGSFAALGVSSIFEYCDVIHACRALITINSGSMSMAAALRRDAPRPVIHSFATDRQFNRRNFIYPNVEYYVQGVTLRSGLLGRLKRMLPRAWR
jgi:hypothetical protein